MDNENQKETAPPAVKIVMISIVLLGVFLSVYFGVNRMLAGGTKNNGKNDGERVKKPRRITQVEAPSSEKVKDPVTGQVISAADAPYYYDYAGIRFYFAGEDSLKEFIGNPLRYSGAKVNVRMNIIIKPDEEDSAHEEPAQYPPKPEEIPSYWEPYDPETPSEGFGEKYHDSNKDSTGGFGEIIQDTPNEYDSSTPFESYEDSAPDSGGSFTSPLPDSLPDRSVKLPSDTDSPSAESKNDGGSEKPGFTLPPGAIVERPRPGSKSEGTSDKDTPQLQTTPITEPIDAIGF